MKSISAYTYRREMIEVETFLPSAHADYLTSHERSYPAGQYFLRFFEVR